MNSNIIFIYTTYPDLSSAKEQSTALLTQRLIACVNFFPQMISMYHWEEKIEESHEVVAIFKTRSDLFSQCQEAIKSRHPYSVPCILKLEITDGAQEYMHWIKQETKQT
jgi:periplasmic divalent cation tolerance protein